MKNKGLFSTLFIEEVREEVELDDNGRGRMATLARKWQTRDDSSTDKLWESFLKQAVSYLQFVPPAKPDATGVFHLFEDFSFTHPVAVLYFIAPDAELDDVSVGRFWPGRLVAELKKRSLNWGILTNGEKWRLYSLNTAKPYEDFVELDLVAALTASDEKEYALFERFFHRDSFVKEETDDERKMATSENADDASQETTTDKVTGIYKCRLGSDAERSEEVLEDMVKSPLLSQVDEILQYLCNGFIADTERKGAEYTEEERREIFESAVKLLYRCLFLFFAEARSLLPSDPEKAEEYRRHSIRHLCEESRKFRWNDRKDTDGFDLWKHLKGLVNAVNDGDTEYGIMGYNGGLFDDSEEKFLGKHKLRNDFLSRALYLLAYVEPWDNDPDSEYAIPYEDLEVRHLGELYENILEFTVMLADADRIRRRTKKGVELLLASDAKAKPGDTRIKKGDVFFGETALERKQTGSYYTPEVLVQFLNKKAIINPLRERFAKDYRKRFGEFCQNAAEGRDVSTRRGAAQSAIALVERFVQEVVLKFRTCDPGMGSGHFLVNAANQISDLIVEFLSEIPCVEGLKSKVSCSPNYWRRLVTRHCVYGVDLNPLAVHLAKLSLWLNCFAQDHRLTFLDHHLKCGNSLIGIRTLGQLEKLPERAKAKKKDDANPLGLDFPDELAEACKRAIGNIHKIEKLDEDATDKMKKLVDDAKEESSGVMALADLYTAYLMDHSIKEEDYRELFHDLSKGLKPRSILAKEIQQRIKDLRTRHHFLHWALEFPEVFGGENPGFDADTGNPPWDVLEPKTLEFYLQYDPTFRSYTKQEASKRIAALHDKYPDIAEKWGIYEATFEEAGFYCKQPSAYAALTAGKIDLFKAFLERFHQTLRKGGKLGIVCPSGFYTDESAKPLRELFLSKTAIHFLYCFENRWPVVFPAVHNSFKFILFCAEKGGTPAEFHCRFMQHDPETLPIIEANSVMLSSESVRKFSPGSLSFMEFNSQRDADIVRAIYDEHPHLNERVVGTWNVQLSQEFNMSSDSHLFNTQGDGAPLYEGKLIVAFDHKYSPLNYWISHDRVLNDEWNGRWRQLKKKKHKPDVFDYQCYRAGFRRIAASTNERAFLSTVIPRSSVCPDTTLVVRRLVPNDDNGEPEEWINDAQTSWLVAMFNSFVVDFVIRMKITTHLDMHFVYTLPIPRLGSGNEQDNIFFWPIVARCLRLTCTGREYGDLWKTVFKTGWQKPVFWYSSTSTMNYGPTEEQAIREKLAGQATGLTANWKSECGLYDRLPDRRDTGDRAQLRAEIDAYVAHLYGLNRDDFTYILDTFPVLKKKEIKAFGEYRSKRKCLEEYDRIGKTLI